MNSLEECEEFVKTSIEMCQNEVKELKEIYSKFFDFNDVLTSEGGGKTRLNRQSLNSDHEEIYERIVKLNEVLDKAVKLISKTIVNEINEKGVLSNSLPNSLVFDDNNFFESLLMELETKVLPKHEKNKLLKRLEKLTALKNRLFNLKYFITMFDTTHMNKLLNKLSIEELINSKLIFEMIDTYGLQNEELEKFEFSLKNFYNQDVKIKSFISFNYFLEHYKRKVDTYEYDNIRYKITLDYDNEVELKKTVFLNIGFIENIISNFIEQSCIDLIKKELKKGKTQKFIEVNIQKHKNSIQVIVKNNGFETKNIQSLYLSDLQNRYIIESRNLASMINAKVDITSTEGTGMQYTLEF